MDFLSNHKIGIAIATLAIIAGVTVLRLCPPSSGSFYPKCVLHSATGLHCPGCGCTRALHSLANLHFTDAVQNNPLLVLGGPIFVAMMFRRRQRRQKGMPTSVRFPQVIAVIVIVYFILRNVPTPGTSWLAPISP